MKSIITCDMEGIIKTMNNAAEEIFGYDKNELIGKKRVSIFSPGEIVLQNVPNWLEVASKTGEYSGKTVFLNKLGHKFNASIKITPTFSKDSEKRQNGFCGVTEIINDQIEVPISFTTKMIKYLAITRMPFSSASLLPIFVVASYFLTTFEVISVSNLAFCSLGVLFAHLSTNMFNDYFDNIDGTDTGNFEYFQQVSGGSRAIELGLISIKKTKYLAIILLITSLFFGILTFLNAHNGNISSIIIITILSLFLGYYYTAPPIRLVSRKGLGELSIFIVFGPLLILGAGFAIYNGDFLTSTHFNNLLIISMPIGLLTTNILLINEFPDCEGDLKTGKNHIVATLGKKKSRYVYLFNLFIIASITLYMAIEFNSLLFTALLFVVVYGSKVCIHLFKNYDNRSLVSANWGTIKLHAGYCILVISSFFISTLL